MSCTYHPSTTTTTNARLIGVMINQLSPKPKIIEDKISGKKLLDKVTSLDKGSNYPQKGQDGTLPPEVGTSEAKDKNSRMELSVIEDISVFKHEYMDMSVPALVGVGEVGEVKLKDRVGGDTGVDFICILFYPADFTQLVREEVIEASQRMDEFKRVKCRVR